MLNETDQRDEKRLERLLRENGLDEPPPFVIVDYDTDPLKRWYADHDALTVTIMSSQPKLSKHVIRMLNDVMKECEDVVIHIIRPPQERQSPSEEGTAEHQ